MAKRKPTPIPPNATALRASDAPGCRDGAAEGRPAPVDRAAARHVPELVGSSGGATPPPYDPSVDQAAIIGGRNVAITNGNAAYDTGNLSFDYGYNPDGTVNTANPYSRAALYQLAYTNSKRGTLNSMAAQGAAVLRGVRDRAGPQRHQLRPQRGGEPSRLPARHPRHPVRPARRVRERRVRCLRRRLLGATEVRLPEWGLRWPQARLRSTTGVTGAGKVHSIPLGQHKTDVKALHALGGNTNLTAPPTGVQAYREAQAAANAQFGPQVAAAKQLATNVAPWFNDFQARVAGYAQGRERAGPAGARAGARPTSRAPPRSRPGP
jgi:hypothetical protein